MSAHDRSIRIAAAMLAALALSGCHDNPTAPPARAEKVLAFVSDGSGTPELYLAGVTTDDSTLRVELRTARPIDVTAVAFSLVVDGTGMTVDSIRAGSTFGGPAVPVSALVRSDAAWLGVYSLRDYGSSVAATGSLLAAYLRRTTRDTFTVAVQIDNAVSMIYGPGGNPIAGTIVGGRAVYGPAVAQLRGDR